jgi:nicotinate-nucleotide adenylyltransferase
MLTGLFGGTFDPVHNTHLAIALKAADTFSLDKVTFVPAGNPPLKPGTQTSWSDRVAMLELAVASTSDPRFEVSRIEEPSANGGARSYSILTIEKLLSAGSGPLAFIVGADAFAEIRKWHRWEDLVRSVEFIVVPRPGSVYSSPPGAIVHEIPSLTSPISSSGIRDSISRGSLDVPVPVPVLSYIEAHGLYRSQHRSQQK